MGVIYRPPEQDAREFCTELDILLQTISKNNKVCTLLGDYNFDLMKHQCHQITSEFWILCMLLYLTDFFNIIIKLHRSQRLNYAIIYRDIIKLFAIDVRC